MKLTKAKYNWLVAQYNYRKNKEEIIEISDEEYKRLTGNKNSNNNNLLDNTTWMGEISIINTDRWGNTNTNTYLITTISFNQNNVTMINYYNDKTSVSYEGIYQINNDKLIINLNNSINNSIITIYDYMISNDKFNGYLNDGFNTCEFNFVKYNEEYITELINNNIVRFSLFLNDLPEIKSGINTPGLFYAVENAIINNSNNPIISIRIYNGMGYFNEHLLSAADERYDTVFNSNMRIVFGQSALNNEFCAYLVDIRMNFISSNIIQIRDNQYDLNNGVCISNENEQGLYKLKCTYDGIYLIIWN